MRKLLLATVASGTLLAGAAVPASAADLRAVPAPAPAFVAPVAPVAAFTWSGAYIGGNVGGIWGKHDFDPVTATLVAGPAAGSECAGGVVFGACGFSLTTDRDSSVIGGFQVGDRWQFGQWVIGVEQDTQWTNVKNTFVLGAATPFTPGGPFLEGDAFEARLKFLSNTRLQAGVAFDRFLVYAAGGLATGVMDVTAFYGPRSGANATPGYAITDDNKFHVGWTVGGGVEWAITDNCSFGVEYRYTELGHETYNLGSFGFSNGRNFTTTADVDFRSHEVIGRLNFKTQPLLAMFGIH